MYCAVFGKESSTKSSGQSRHPAEMLCKRGSSSTPLPRQLSPQQSHQVQVRVDHKVTLEFAARGKMLKLNTNGQTTIEENCPNQSSVSFGTMNFSPLLRNWCWTSSGHARSPRKWTNWSWNLECEEAIVSLVSKMNKGCARKHCRACVNLILRRSHYSL